MNNAIYNLNNFVFYSQTDIELRDYLVKTLAQRVEHLLRERNRSWLMERIEAPMLISREMLNPEYDDDKMFVQKVPMTSYRAKFQADAIEQPLTWWAWCTSADAYHLFQSMPADPEEWDDTLDHVIHEYARIKLWNLTPLVLRPETTPSTYAYMQHRLQSKNLLPYCVWQINKSFRREQDQPSKHMRLKEFYQQEFQCAYRADSHDDYQYNLLPALKTVFEELTMCPTRIVVSDRLPKYSARTFDIEVWNSEKWMEIASLSKRLDFPVQTPHKTLVFEIATSPDRQMYCRERSHDAWKTLPDDTADIYTAEDQVDNSMAMSML